MTKPTLEIPLSPPLPLFLEQVREHPEYNLYPVYATLVADHLTPVSAFARLSEKETHAFLLESVVGGEKIARYSFLAVGPQIVVQAHDHEVTITRFPQPKTAGSKPEARNSELRISSDPLTDVQALVAGYQAYPAPGLPRFAGGLVGYAGYDTVRYVEGKSLPRPPADDRHLPDLMFGLYDAMVIFDHVDKTIKVLVQVHLPRGGARTAGVIRRAYQAAQTRIGSLVGRLQPPRQERHAPEVCPIQVSGPVQCKFTSNMTRPAFEQMVTASKEYIKAGDIFQVVLSQRLRVKTTADPYAIYRTLRIINPSPFMFYLKSPEVTLVGASPEILCRVEDGVVTNRPLAGTRHRGATEAEDKALEAELLADPKDRAEHIMLVDLGRNDVGRVSELGSVKLTECMTVERYSHVMHISSEVQGKLAAGKNAFDALQMALPVGTVSGAPKIRAMQIIDELESTRRGPYGGAIGYVDFSGNMDTCIALRTMVITKENAKRGTRQAARKDQRSKIKNQKYVVDVQVGAGIVADSVPSAEYEETINKSKALLRAIEVAEKQVSGPGRC